jgi:hypothetical protein
MPPGMPVINFSKHTLFPKELSRAGQVSFMLFFVLLGVASTYAAKVVAQTVVYPAGALYQTGISNIAAKESNSGWTSNAFSCAGGYTLTSYHYDEGSSNNATWYACVPAGSSSSGIAPNSNGTDDCGNGCLAKDPYISAQNRSAYASANKDGGTVNQP